MWLGSGVIGGIGLGLGYISPVSTFVKWFPDRRGMATGMAIMGFGGGAMIGAPLANLLMNISRRRPRSAHGRPSWPWGPSIRLHDGRRVPLSTAPGGWKPAGWNPPRNQASSPSIRCTESCAQTPQFWLIWWVLCLNVSAGIGIISMASPMLQEVFGGRLIGHPSSASTRSAEIRKSPSQQSPQDSPDFCRCSISAGVFSGRRCRTISAARPPIRFFSCSASPSIVGAVLCADRQQLLFVEAFGIILTMYGGGFATVPAYLADIFGTKIVGAIQVACSLPGRRSASSGRWW